MPESQLLDERRGKVPPASPRVSVVTPAYNAERTIGETLQSLLDQTFTSWESVIVDDGSSDGTADVVRAFVERDERFRLVQADHGGEAAARNAGLAHVSGTWVLFLDADDWIEPTHLERLLSVTDANAELDAVHCGYARVALDGTRVVEQYEPPVGDLFAVLARRAAFPVHACLVRRAKLVEVGGFDTSLRTSTDWDLWQRVARTGARFGAVREPLAMYRMQPQSASLNAGQLLDDGLEVLRRGHSPDPRVMQPRPEHADGMPPELVRTQVYYLLAWCAGLAMGAGQSPMPLLDRVDSIAYPELNAEAIAQCLFESAMLPSSGSPEHWIDAWTRLEPPVRSFLAALEGHSQAADLAERASTALGRLILERSLATGERRVFLDAERRHWTAIVDEAAKEANKLRGWGETLEAERGRLTAEVEGLQSQAATDRREIERLTLETERQTTEFAAAAARLEGEVARLSNERDLIASSLSDARANLAALTAEVGRLEMAIASVRRRQQQSEAEKHALQDSLEHRFGSLLVNEFKLRGAAETADALRARSEHAIGRLRFRRSTLGADDERLRVIATICADFPIYSQTFVHQELTQLVRGGFNLRLIYSMLNARDGLGESCAELWPLKQRLRLHRPTHERDYAYYKNRQGPHVQRLTERLCDASGLSWDAVTHHDNFLQAFTFTRLAEAFRPHYLHSYFFYDRSLMSLVAAWLLEVPRGVTCYADHVLQDYELKVVPLHLELCDVVVATSARIKRELLTLAPSVDPEKIIVKPNAIDTSRFTPREREAPAPGQPWRLVCTARIEPKKGLLYLVEAVHLLRERGLNVEAHIVGAPDPTPESQEYKERLDALITALGLWGRVHLEGRQNEEGVRRFLDLAHVFVAPFVETEGGDKDGIPTSLLEAMASGLPVIATDAGSITDVITSSEDGTIVPQRDPRAIATGVEDILSLDARRLDRGHRAVQAIKLRFDVRQCEGLLHDAIRQSVKRIPGHAALTR